jgi:hypothetical protein
MGRHWKKVEGILNSFALLISLFIHEYIKFYSLFLYFFIVISQNLSVDWLRTNISAKFELVHGWKSDQIENGAQLES